MFKSTDWGRTWSILPTAFTNPALVAVSPTDSNTIFVGTQEPALYVSHDGGATWGCSSRSC